MTLSTLSKVCVCPLLSVLLSSSLYRFLREKNTKIEKNVENTENWKNFAKFPRLRKRINRIQLETITQHYVSAFWDFFENFTF